MTVNSLNSLLILKLYDYLCIFKIGHSWELITKTAKEITFRKVTHIPNNIQFWIYKYALLYYMTIGNTSYNKSETILQCK